MKDLTFGEGEGSRKTTQKFTEFDRKSKTEKKQLDRACEEGTLVYEKFPFKWSKENSEVWALINKEIEQIEKTHNKEGFKFELSFFICCFNEWSFEKEKDKIDNEIFELEIKKTELEKIINNFTTTSTSREVGRAEIKRKPKAKIEQVYKKKSILYQAKKKWDTAKPFLLIISLIAAVSLAVAFFLRKKLLSWIDRKKEEDEKSYLKEIKTKFRGWRVSMYSCAVFYVIFFLVFKFLISVFVEPYIGDWLKKAPNRTVLSVTLFLGVLFIRDTPSLKFPFTILTISFTYF